MLRFIDQYRKKQLPNSVDKINKYLEDIEGLPTFTILRRPYNRTQAYFTVVDYSNFEDTQKNFSTLKEACEYVYEITRIRYIKFPYINCDLVKKSLEFRERDQELAKEVIYFLLEYFNNFQAKGGDIVVSFNKKDRSSWGTQLFAQIKMGGNRINKNHPFYEYLELNFEVKHHKKENILELKKLA